MTFFGQKSKNRDFRKIEIFLKTKFFFFILLTFRIFSPKRLAQASLLSPPKLKSLHKRLRNPWSTVFGLFLIIYRYHGRNFKILIFEEFWPFLDHGMKENLFLGDFGWFGAILVHFGPKNRKFSKNLKKSKKKISKRSKKFFCPSVVTFWNFPRSALLRRVVWAFLN